MSSYTITQSNLFGFPALDAVTPDPTFQIIIKPVYEFGDEFGLDLDFAYSGGEEYNDVNVFLTSFTSQLSIFNVVQVNSKKFRIRGRAIDVFLDQYYEFNMSTTDVVLKRLPPDTTEDFAALVKYEPPNVFRLTKTHTINYRVEYTPNPNFGAAPGDASANPPVPATPASPVAPLIINTSTVFSQDVVWRYDIAYQRVQALLARGKL